LIGKNTIKLKNKMGGFRLKVLMFGWEYPPFISGGLGMACYGISMGLANNDVDVQFIIPSKRGQIRETHEHIEITGADEITLSEKYKDLIERYKDLLGKEKLEGLASPYYTSLKSGEAFSFLRRGHNKNSILSFHGNYGDDLMFQVLMYSIIGEVLGYEGGFDIIHAHDWLTFLAGIAAKGVSKKPLVVHVHATEFDRSGDNYNDDVYRIERYGMEQADKVVAVSHYTKDILITRYGIPPHKIEVVHNAVTRQKQLERLHIKNSFIKKIVLFLGRVTMQKGPDYFIEAANLVLKRVKDVHFVMAGSGDMMPGMITRMASLRIADRFHFTGFLGRLEVERMYAMSNLYVMPSVSEPFGLTAFEALLYDVPIIISKQSGAKEILKNAVTIDFWDVQKLADTIVSLLKDPKYAGSVVERCQEDMKHIGWNNSGYKLMNIYKALVYA
jgi:glycogen(starch) synthase